MKYPRMEMSVVIVIVAMLVDLLTQPVPLSCTVVVGLPSFVSIIS